MAKELKSQESEKPTVNTIKSPCTKLWSWSHAGESSDELRLTVNKQRGAAISGRGPCNQTMISKVGKI